MKEKKETLFGLNPPPFNLEIKCNIGKVYFKLLDKHFRKSFVLKEQFSRDSEIN